MCGPHEGLPTLFILYFILYTMAWMPSSMRRCPPPQVAGGRVYTGRQALVHGLVDEAGACRGVRVGCMRERPHVRA